MCTKLKSDHFGIEMKKKKLVSDGCIGLKSDHFGIEILKQSG